MRKIINYSQLFQINDYVKVLDGVYDIDSDIEIGGFQGKVIEAEIVRKKQYLIVELDDLTVHSMDLSLIDYCINEGIDMEFIKVEANDVVMVEPDEIKRRNENDIKSLGTAFQNLTRDDIRKSTISKTGFNDGVKYATSGAIEKYIVNNGKIFATVENNYDSNIVQIIEDKKRIVPVCSCGRNSIYCKHIVAVLMHTIDKLAISRRTSTPETNTKVKEPLKISNKADAQEIANLVTTAKERQLHKESNDEEIDSNTTITEEVKQQLPEYDSAIIDLFRRAKSLNPLFAWINSRSHPLGKLIFENKTVYVTDVNNIYVDLDVKEPGGSIYKVRITNKKNEFEALKMTCNCATAQGFGSYTTCGHQVAAAYTLHQIATENVNPVQKERDLTYIWESKLSKILNISDTPKKQTSASAMLILSLKMTSQNENWIVKPYTISTSAFNKEDIDDKDKITRLLSTTSARYEAKEISLHSNLPAKFLYSNAELTKTVRIIALSNNYYVGNSLEFALPHLHETLLFRADDGYNGNPFAHPIIQVDNTPRKLLINIEQNISNTRIQPQINIDDEILHLSHLNTFVISNNPFVILTNNRLFQIDGNPELLKRMLDTQEIDIPESGKKTFVTRYLPKLIDYAHVSGNSITKREELNVSPVNRIYLSEKDDAIIVDLAFAYNLYEMTLDLTWPDDAMQFDEENETLMHIFRHKDEEMEAWQNLSSFGLKRDENHFVLRQKVSAVDFLLNYLPKIQAAGYEVYGEELLKNSRVNRNFPKMKLSISSGIDWFDVSTVISYGDVEVSFSEVRKAMKHRQGYVKLPDGSMGVLPEELLAQYRIFFALGQDTEQGIRMSKTQATLLELTLQNAEVDFDEEFTNRVNRLKNFDGIKEQILPSNFVGELRHYQKTGFDWLHFLHEYGFGGCLADDMGIGKTVQALVFLQSLLSTGHTTSASLVVMPRSLLENWARESAKFTPDLKVLIHADIDRSESHTTFDGYDMVLTTYGVMLRDIELFRQYKFHYIILDEAQVIKNAVSQSAHAARLLNGEHRLALTGTPVENSTVELWSLFAFLNPGQLGSLDAFRNQFANPIQRNQNEKTAQILRAIVHPFILRRTKEQVAPELPPRTERLIYCEMSPSQKKLYIKTRDKYRDELMGLIDNKGIQNAHLKVLEGLLRLRQLANDPRLIDKSFKGESSKFEAILEAMEVLREEGHKALIFSQFTSMLSLLRTSMDARQWPYLYLDGKTKKRQDLVDKFQEDENIPFFLISLKAGGTGLNLTAADYVIHIDPWWNPAVERQATDRTHRIGQERPVMVYKFIAEETVEEKILVLQEKKQQLVDQLISTESTLMKSLTRDDVAALFM